MRPWAWALTLAAQLAWGVAVVSFDWDLFQSCMAGAFGGSLILMLALIAFGRDADF